MNRKLKFFLRFLIVLILLGTGLLIGVNVYLNSGRTKILQSLSGKELGTLTFKRANFDVWSSFPYMTLKLRQVVVEDSLFESHQTPLLEAQKINVRFYLLPLLKGQFDPKSLSIQGGKLHLLTLSDGYNNLKSLLSGFSSAEKKSSNSKNLISLSRNILRVNLHEFDVEVENQKEQQRVAGHIPDLSATLNLADNSILAEVDMKVHMEEMTLNPKKGAFFKDATISGSFNSLISLDSQYVTMASFPLSVNDQLFQTEIFFQTGGERLFEFKLENEATQFRNSIQLLNPGIQHELRNYNILAPFYSYTTIKGRLVKGNHALVEIDYDIQDSPIGIWEYQLDSVYMKGHFVNRIYGDTLSINPIQRHFRIEIDKGTASFQGIHLSTQNALFTKKQPDTASFQIALLGDGYPKQLSSLLENEKFLFNKGKFALDMTYEGKYDGMEDVLKGSYAILQLKDFEVSYAPIKVSFPIRELRLDKAAGDSRFKIVSNTFSQKNEFVIAGGLQNFPNLIFDREPGKTTSTASITAKKLSWADFLDLFGEQGILNTSPKAPLLRKTETLKQFVSGLYDSFQPNLDIAIDTLVYSDEFEVVNFRSSLYYKDLHTLVLEDTHFDYEEGHLTMSLELDLEDPELTPFKLCLNTEKVNLQKLLPPFDYFDIQYFKKNKNIPNSVSLNIVHEGVLRDHVGLVPNSSKGKIDFSINDGESAKGVISYKPDSLLNETVSESYISTHIQITGEPQLISDFINNEKFFFRGGRFDVEFAYTGDIEDLGELLNETVSTLRVYDTEIFYKPVGITFPIRQLEFEIQEEVADFDLNMYSDSLEQEINIRGNLNNFGALVLEENTQPVSTEVKISSPHLSWDKFLGFFKRGSQDPTYREVQGLKNTLVEVYESFNPTLELVVDTFTYNEKLQFREINSRVQLDDNHTLVLDSTGLSYGEGSADLIARFSLKKNQETPFYLNFKTEEIDLAKFMDDFDYFNVSTFRDIEKMAGKVSLDGVFIGAIKDSVGLIPEESQGTLFFLVEDAQVKGFDRLEDLADKVFRRSRFEDIYFAPITNTISIKGNRIEIPRMEIQSTALSMFVEGTFSYQDSTSIWVSIPINNLKRREANSPPPKIGYENAGKKIYVEVYTDEQQVDQLRLRLNKKKFYQQRGIEGKYREEKRQNKKARRQFKRNQRKGKSPL